MPETVLFLHIPKSGGSTLKSCIIKSVYKGLIERPPGDPRIAKFLREEVYFYPIGFYKDPVAGPLEYVRSALLLQGLEAVVGHFSFGLHRHISSPSTYVTMLRDPVERVISLYYHLTAAGIWRADVGLDEFVRDCPAHGWSAELSRWHPFPSPFSEYAIRLSSRTIVDNDQTRRIAGLEPPFGACGKDTLKQAIDNLTKYFGVVGLVEHFDESLLMMINHFNWNPQMYYLPRLINRSKPRAEVIPTSVRDLIQERNALDCELYQRAQEIYETTLAQQGADFKKQVEELRERNRAHRSANEEAVRGWEIKQKQMERNERESG